MNDRFDENSPLPDVRLVRRVDAPTGRGPGNGMFALQRALARTAPGWLKIGGAWLPGEIPWFWSWEDRPAAALCAELGIPFVTGPNQLFSDSRAPGRDPAERAIVAAPSCRLVFTESAWYRELIRCHQGPAQRAPIVLWPYPIEPPPEGPLPPEFDVLVYLKSGCPGELPDILGRRWKRVAVVRYGCYGRGELIATARRSRACLYGSIDDRGPLALAEILLAGCPAVGVPRGAPWIRHARTGYRVACFDPVAVCRAIGNCHGLSRQTVRDHAQRRFDTARTVRIILAALRRVRVAHRAARSRT